MTQRDILDTCLKKPGAFIDYPFGPDSTIVKVRAEGCNPAGNTASVCRIFAQLFTLKGQPMATFNCDMMTGEFYRGLYPGTVVRGYHCPPVQQPYFNTVALNGTVPDAELLRMIDHAYAFVVSKLPRWAQNQLV